MQTFKNIQNELIERINKATSSLEIAVTWFTNHDLFDAVLKKLENPDFEASLIVLNDRINNKKEGVDFQAFIDRGGNFYYSSEERMVHHKFCIIDNKIVITGSYNWTYYAENRNYENIILLNDSVIAKSYLEEFESVIQNHEKVDNVLAKQKMSAGINSHDYLKTDYTFQAEKEEERGNDLALAKIYTEILKLDNKQLEIQKARTAVVQKINSQAFETCPFEIGIHFRNGYAMMIPAFTPLPITVKKNGTTPVNDATSLQITIQKYDYRYQDLLKFSLEHLKVAPADTPKIEHTMTVDKNGILTVYCLELNGYGRSKTMRVDLRNYL
ncbi:MAG: phospholipase D-like domain-containing protein [Hymenobacter sp.]